MAFSLAFAPSVSSSSDSDEGLPIALMPTGGDDEARSSVLDREKSKAAVAGQRACVEFGGAHGDGSGKWVLQAATAEECAAFVEAVLEAIAHSRMTPAARAKHSRDGTSLCPRDE